MGLWGATGFRWDHKYRALMMGLALSLSLSFPLVRTQQEGGHVESEYLGLPASEIVRKVSFKQLSLWIFCYGSLGWLIH